MTEITETPESPVFLWLKGVPGITHPEALYECILELESFESWVFQDDSEEARQIGKLLITLQGSDFKNSSLVPSTEFADFLKVLAYTKCGNAFWLLSLIHQKQPDVTGDLLAHCRYETSKDAQKESALFMTRLKFLIKKQCFHEVYGEERRRNILRLIEKVNSEK